MRHSSPHIYKLLLSFPRCPTGYETSSNSNSTSCWDQTLGRTGRAQLLSWQLTLGYDDANTAASTIFAEGSLETNKGLTEKSDKIKEQWEISQRTRDDTLFYYLHPVSE